MITVKCCNRVDTFSEFFFFVAVAKRELFIWKRKHEALLLREVVVEEPHKYRPGARFSKVPVTSGPDNLSGPLSGNFTGPDIAFLEAPVNFPGNYRAR